MRKIPLTYHLLFSVCILVLVVVFSIGTGYYKFSSGNAYEVFFQFFTQREKLPIGDQYIIWDIRMSRIIMGVLIGSLLAVAGTLLQGMFKNPLATGDLIGLNSGATLFAAIAIVLGHLFKESLPDWIHYSLVSVAAFCGALLSMLLVYRISTSQGKTNVVLMLLSGVAITSIGFAITGFLIYLAKDDQLRDLTFWNLGSLAGATWLKNSILFCIMLISYSFLITKGKVLNAMMLGEKDAQHLGIKVEQIKKKIVFFSALIIGTCVAFSGTIGFIGLIIPYILRQIFRSNYQYILPLSAVFGGVLLVFADTLSRVVVAPTELPIGIITAVMGGPIFISILLKQKRNF